MRGLIFCEEDRHLFTRERWTGGFRWYKAVNVVCERFWTLPLPITYKILRTFRIVGIYEEVWKRAKLPREGQVSMAAIMRFASLSTTCRSR